MTGLVLCASVAVAQIGGEPGAYSRMGFSARGIAMGNAMTAVATGDVVSYYNPAVVPWIGYRSASVSYGILSLDRQLNTLSYGVGLKPSAGLSVGIINAGVSDIDGRDSDGNQTGSLQTSENQIFLGFGIRFPAGWSAGLNIKLLYYNLYSSVNSLTVGLDFGVLAPLSDDFTVGLTIRDLNSKYKWDTSTLFGQQGQSVEDKFPLLYTVGAAWALPDSFGLVSAEIEVSNVKSLFARAGIEVPVIPELTLRAGIDRIDLREKGSGIKPSFGFTLAKNLDSWTPCLNYAFVLEPFSPGGIHIVSLGVRF